MFFTDTDRRAYLRWLKEYCDKYGVDVLAYCLMRNHVHLVAVPRRTESLQAALKPLHMRYAQRVNRERDWQGHLWQGRFFSSPLDEHYLWAEEFQEMTDRHIEKIDEALAQKETEIMQV